MSSYVIDIRRQLHKNPEIGFELPKTLKLIRSELDKMDVPYTEKYGKSSIVATVNEGKSNFTIGVRADIDALPMEEENDVPYRSQIKGQMHACGHDAHTAIALATLKHINEIRDDIHCCVKFIFQSAEEYEISGAKLMAEDGVMDGIDCIVALHCDVAYCTGEIGVQNGEQGAVSDGFWLDFYGKSTHVAKQQQGIDAIMMAVKAYTAIEFMFAKELPANATGIFNVGSIHGGSTNNIICDHCRMYCTMRTHDDDVAEKAIGRIKQIIEGVALGSGGRAEFTQGKLYPVVYNNEIVSDLMRKAAGKIVGEENVLPKIRSMDGEDFSFFTMQKPGCMFRLGIRNDEKGITYGAHQSRFDIDEDSLEIGVKVFTQFILDNMDGIEF